MQSVVVVAVLFFLAIQSFPIAIGIDAKKSKKNALLFVLVLALMQTCLLWAGLQLGGLFMHLMDGFKGIVLFLGFSLIGIRMLMEVLQIRKGSRTYQLDRISHVFFAALAQSMNTLIAGLMLTYLVITGLPVLSIIIFSSLFISVAGVLLPTSKQTLSLAALLYLLGGLVMMVAGVYLAFFAN